MTKVTQDIYVNPEYATNILALSITDEIVKQGKNSGGNLKDFDPITITMMVIALINLIVTLLKKRVNKVNVTAADIQQEAGKLNMIQRFLLKLKALSILKNDKNQSDVYKTFQAYGDTSVKTTLQKLSTCDPALLNKVLSQHTQKDF